MTRKHKKSLLSLPTYPYNEDMNTNTHPTMKLLIQIVGKQTLPNALPILALKPDIVANLYTKTTAKAREKLQNWIKTRDFGHPIEECGVEIDDNNQYESTLAYCREVLRVSAGQEILFNMTGGTKLMSLAMYQTAAEHGNVAVIYQETPREGTKDYASLLKWLLCEDKKNLWYSNYNAADRLNIDDFLFLGEQPPLSPKQRDWRAMVDAARAVQSQLRSDRGRRNPNGNEGFLGYVNRRPALIQSFKAAGCPMEGGRFCNARDNKFFTGGWWEVLTADYLSSQNKYTDIRCSVETKVCDDKNTEVDVLATDGFSLTCYSCKVALQNPDSEIQKHKSRAKALGGEQSIFGISVYSCSRASGASMMQFASAAGADVITGLDVFPTDQMLIAKL